MYFRSYFGVVRPARWRSRALAFQNFGWLASAFFASFALLQVPVGMAFDRWGARWPMTLMMMIGAAGSALVGASSGLWSSFAGQLGIGIGCAPIFMGVLYHLKDTPTRLIRQEPLQRSSVPSVRSGRFCQHRRFHGLSDSLAGAGLAGSRPD